MELIDKVALVSGGAIRLGRAISLALAKAGCHVFVHYGKSAGPAVEVKEAIKDMGRQAVTFSADLSDTRNTRKIVPAAIEAFGQIDILINNAAVFPEDDRFDYLTDDRWDWIHNINAKSPFILSQDFARHVGNDRAGRIININDARISRPNIDHFAYRISKQALSDLTNLLALELAPNITVNQLSLGAILPPPGKPHAYLDLVAEGRIPLKRHGDPEIVAENVIHILKQDFLTGATLQIDGGEHL